MVLSSVVQLLAVFAAMAYVALVLSVIAAVILPVTMAQRSMVLALDEEFHTLNLSLWQHEITMSGGGNWEFEHYTNNRSNKCHLY